MSKTNKINQTFYPVTSPEAREWYKKNYISTTGYILVIRRILRPPGIDLVIPNVLEFCREWDITKSAFYRAINTLTTNGDISWEATEGIVIKQSSKVVSIKEDVANTVPLVGHLSHERDGDSHERDTESHERDGDSHERDSDIYIDCARVQSISELAENTYPPTPEGERECEKKFGFEIEGKKPLVSEPVHPITRMESRLNLGQTVRQQRREYLEASAHPSLVFSENTPWLEPNSTTETPIFHRPFIAWGAECLMKFSSSTLERAKGNFETKLLNDPRKITIEWRAYAETLVHTAVVVAARVNNGISVGQDELDNLTKNQRAFTGITAESTESIDPKIMAAAQPALVTPMIESVATVTEDIWDKVKAQTDEYESSVTTAPEGAENAQMYKHSVDLEKRAYFEKIDQQRKQSLVTHVPTELPNGPELITQKLKEIANSKSMPKAREQDKKERTKLSDWNDLLLSGLPSVIADVEKKAIKAGYIIVDGQVVEPEF